jgi:hypothetical protein
VHDDPVIGEHCHANDVLILTRARPLTGDDALRRPVRTEAADGDRLCVVDERLPRGQHGDGPDVAEEHVGVVVSGADPELFHQARRALEASSDGAHMDGIADRIDDGLPSTLSPRGRIGRAIGATDKGERRDEEGAR